MSAATYSIHREGAASAGVLAPLWADVLRAGDRSESKASWFYRDAPAGAGDVFVLRSGAGRVVGSAGAGRRTVVAGGARLAAALLADFAIERDHRGGLAAISLQRAVRASLAGDVDVVYGFPLPPLVGLFKRLGYVVLGHVERWVRVLRVSPYVDRAGSVALTAIARAALDPALAAVDGAVGLGLRGRRRLAWLAGVDARFDALAARAAELFGVLGDRSARALAWRFFTRGARPDLAALVAPSGELEGYAVVAREGSMARVLDVLASTPAGFARVLGALLPALRGRGFDSVSVALLAPLAVRDALAGLGFERRGASRPVILDVGDRARRLREALTSREAWLLTELDEDE
jgi:hypothetical protein